MKRLGMTLPLQSLPLAEHADWVRELEDLGYSDVWTSEAQDVDGLVPLALASQWAPGLRLGCACLPVQTRGPATLAMGISALCDTAPGRVVVGLGCSSEPIVRHWNALPFEKPYQRTRDTVQFLRAALAGEKVDHAYETFSVRGFRLRRKASPPPPILVAALRAGMLELAGRVGDGVILNYVTPEDLPKVISHVKKFGAEKEIAARIYVCPTTDAERVRAVGRMSIAAYFNVPTYRAHQEWLGRAPLLAAHVGGVVEGRPTRRPRRAARRGGRLLLHPRQRGAVPRAHRRLSRRGPRHADHRPRRGGDGSSRSGPPAGPALSDAFGNDPGRGPARRQLRTTC